MTEASTAMAKLAGIQKAVEAVLKEKINVLRNGGNVRLSFSDESCCHYFEQSAAQLKLLQVSLPKLYGDFQQISVRPEQQGAPVDGGQALIYYSRAQLERLSRDILQVFEIRASSEHTAPLAKVALRRIFISHGHASDWREVQSHIEKDLELTTLELAQEASGGQTIIEKLEARSAQCDAAVIVMSGDDLDQSGQLRARENVMHEIGYFHGRYGRKQVIMLHEDGVVIPTNLSGIVYVPYPKGTPNAAFGTLDRELRAIYRF